MGKSPTPATKPARTFNSQDAHWVPLEQLLAEADAEEDRTEDTSTSTFLASQGEFTRGQLVKIVGLKAKPALNGAVGKLLRYETQSGRWHFQLLSGIEVVKVRPENMTADEAPDGVQRDTHKDEVKMPGLVSSVELCG